MGQKNSRAKVSRDQNIRNRDEKGGGGISSRDANAIFIVNMKQFPTQMNLFLATKDCL